MIRRPLALVLALCVGLASAARAQDDAPEYKDIVKEKCKEFKDTYKKVGDDQVNALLTGLSDLYKQGKAGEDDKALKEIVVHIARATTLKSDPMVRRAIELLADTDENALGFIEKSLDRALKAKPIMKTEIYEACFAALGKLASPKSIKTLTGFLKYKEPDVIAQAANALKGYAGAPGKIRKEIFEEILKMSEGVYSKASADANSPEAKRWRVYGPAMIEAMKSVSHQDELADPRQFRAWFNDHKKANWDKLDES